MVQHVSSITRTYFYHLRRLREIRCHVGEDAAVQLVSALRLLQFSLSRVTSDDDCTSATCAKCSCQARLQPATSRPCHTSLTATALAAYTGANYLEVVRLDAHSGLIPSYLSQTLSSCQTSVRRPELRSESSLDYILPRLCTKFGERAFSHAGPHAWNSFLLSIRSLTDLKTFKKQLKTHLFTTSFTVL
jgi:hypothetical protein